jgi:hypothetical protein
MPTGRFLLCFVGATGLGVPACTPAPDAAWPVAITLVDSVTGVMPTTFPDVVVLRSGPVCVPDTYLHKVRCFDPASREWTAFGREGSGPGEFRALGPLIRVAGRDSLIGVVDIRHNRFSVHDADGLYHGGYSVPPLFRPISEVGPRALSGLWVSYAPTEQRTGRLARLDAQTGTSLAQVTMEERVGAGESTAGFARGVELNDGTMVLNITRHRFARFSADGHKLADLELPDHLRAPIYPTERDIEVFRYELRRLFGREPSQAQVEEFSNKPMHPVVREANLRVGPHQTVWVASARDRVLHSYLDVFHADHYLGSVQVRHRLLGFDVLGDTLVVLVERPEEDVAGPVRGLDWYRIGLTPPPSAGPEAGDDGLPSTATGE